MRLPKIAIENYQFTLIVILVLIVSGVISFLTMPRSEDPLVTKAGGTVIAIYPGTPPVDMERLIVDPLEEAINEISDIKKVDAFIKDGVATIYVEFSTGTDPDEKYSELVQQISSVRNQLPEELMSLSSLQWQLSNVNILQLALISDSLSYRELEQAGKRLKKKLERVKGIKRVKLWAFPKQEVRVAVDLEKLARMNIPLSQIIDAIKSYNINIPGGHIDLGTKRFNIHTSGNYQSLQEIKNTIIHTDGMKLVYLKDVATVSFDYEDKNYFARVNGRKAIFITVNQKEHTNIFKIMKGLKAQVEDYRQNLPPQLELLYVFDQSRSVAHRMNSFFTNLLQGIILVGLVVFLTLSFRSSIIVMLAIPVSIFIGIGFVDLCGYGLEQMSIAGLVIALGILVDNAIVVTENVSRFLKMNFSRKEAAVEGTKQIGWAIVSATVTTVFAFVPLMMMRDITGDFIRSMPVTVVFTLTASLLVALTLTPYLTHRFLRIDKVSKENKIQQLLTYIIEKPYRSTLNYALSHNKPVLLITIVLFVLSLALFPLVGISFFPKAEKPQFIINIETPEGSSLAQTDEVAKFVESVLMTRKEIQHYAANIGRSNPRIYYNVIEKYEKSTHAQFFVQVKNNYLKKMPQLIEDLRKAFARCPNAHIEVKELEQGPPVEAPIAIKILGENLETLRIISRDVERMITSTNGTINVFNPLSSAKTDLQVKINRAKAGLYGIPLVEIDRTVRTCITGMPISQYRDQEGKKYNIVVRLPIGAKPTLADFDKIYLTSVTGAQIPLKQVASIEFKASPQRINHFNLQRSVTVTADVKSDYSVDKVTRKIIARLEKYSWPSGYRYYVGGELESREESFGGMTRAIIIAMLGIFGVLVLQFRSFAQPLIVFSAIPFALIGSIIALLITGNTFSFTAFIGLTSLVGIVVNNSIILVDYTNQLRQQGKGLIEALKTAGETRFRPILITTGTTIGGLLPLTLLGGSLWAPLGWTIIGGLIVSTFLTLLLVPILYKIFTPDFKNSA